MPVCKAVKEYTYCDVLCSFYEKCILLLYAQIHQISIFNISYPN